MKNLCHYLTTMSSYFLLILLSCEVTEAQTVWNVATSFSTPRRAHTCEVYNGYLYVIGGSSSDDAIKYNDVQYAPINADGSLGSWVTTSAFNTERRNHTSNVYNGYLYIMGGVTNSGIRLNDVQYAPINADGSIGPWQYAASLNPDRFSHSSVAYNGYLYVIQGFYLSAGSPIATIQFAPINADGSLGSWQTTLSYSPARWGQKSIAHNNYLYSMGGAGYNLSTGYFTYGDTKYTSINSDGNLDEWQSGTAFDPSLDGAGLVIYNDYLILAGGYNIPAGCVNEIKFARINEDGSIGTWQNTMTPYNTSRYSHAVAEYNGYIYIIGGMDPGSIALNDVEYAKIDVPPAAPQNLSATPGSGLISLSWDSNNEEDFLHYNIYGGTDPNPTALISTTEDGNRDANSFTISGLDYAATYYYRITAVDNASMESEYSNEVGAATLSALAGEYLTDGNTAALWHLNEPSGAVAYDFSGNDNDGPITGTTVGSGQFGSAREFYTASDQIIVPNDESLNFGTGPYTIEFWVKAPAGSGGHPLHKRGNTTLGTTGRGWFTNIENNKISISLYNDPTLDGEAGNCGFISNRDVADDTWHHVAFVNTYESILCYIDGFLDSQIPIPWQGSPDNDGSLDIGVASHTGEFLGALDEIRISNKARTPDEFSVNPGIRINSPNGGETWQAGTEQNINWNSVGTSGNVTLEFSRNNGAGWATIIESTTDNGAYLWTIPNEPCTECLIRVADTDGDPTDVSDGVFTVLDQYAPSAGYPHASSYHDRFRDGHEQYGIELSVMVQDPQGPGDIATVKVKLPDNSVWDLFDDGQHADGAPGDGNYGLNILTGAEPPVLGDYIFTITDVSANTATATDALQQIISIPGNMTPAHGAFMTVSEHPTFTWDAVPDANNYSIDVMDVNGNNIWNYGDITTNSIEHNINGSGQALMDGNIYQWQLQAYGNDGRSWQEPITFTYSSNTENPVASNAYVGSMHNMNFNGNENFGLELYVNIGDPQGLTNIASVIVSSPTGTNYTLYDNGQNADNGPGDGRYGVHIWDIAGGPTTGTYTFTVTDMDGNTAVVTDVLNRVIDVPRNTQPLNNSIVNTATPTFSWDAVPDADHYWIGVHDMQHNDVWSQNDIYATSIVYNDNLSGVSLVEGQMYQWQVSTQVEDGRSWHEWTTFIYSGNTTDPFVSNPGVYSMHRGDDYGNEGYGVELYVNVADPQGSGDISSVTVTSPTGTVYHLFDNGQDGDDEANNGRYGIHIWDFSEAPPLGTYSFNVTDLEGNSAGSTDVLDNIIDYPRNLSPANNEVVIGEGIVFSWNDVPGAMVYGVDVRDINNNLIWSAAASTNSITYTGPDFTDGSSYRWNVGTATVIDARSWHDGVTFVYSSDPDKPIITYTQVYTVHDRFTNGNEQYRLELNADVMDPQGTADITSVTVTAPGGEIYTLYNDGMHSDGNAGDSRFSNYDLPLTGSPATGDYTFTAVDGLGNTATLLDPLNSIPMVPGNMVPENNGYVSIDKPDYRWDAIPGATSYTIDVQDVNNNFIWSRNNITSNTVQHNDDGLGTDLVEGHIYRWQLQAYTDEGRSWQEWLTFVYSPDGGSPVAENPSVRSMHWGRDQQYDNYGLEFRLNASDPQGLANVATVTVQTSGGPVYSLYDDGQHNDNGAHDGYFGNNIWNLPDAPPTGEYIFTVTDADANTVTTNDILDNVIDIPRNAQPANNSLLNSQDFTFSWTAVGGVSSYSVNIHDGTNQVWHKDNISSTSVQYNDDGLGLTLVDGKTYYWNISTALDDASSWIDENCFVYSTDADNPIAVNPSVQSRHWGMDQVYEYYGLELRLNVMDPQGLENISSVTVTTPGGLIYELYDDGQHADNIAGDGNYGNNIWNLAEAPVTGEYVFTVIDEQTNTVIKNDILNHVIDIPKNVQPAHNSFITTATPEISWNEVPGATSYWLSISDGITNLWSRGGITGTSVVYNDDGSAQPLQEGKTYYLNVNAGLDDAISWNDGQRFTYSNDPFSPVANDPVVRSMHRGDDQGNEGWALELYVTAADPQGPGNIQSVTATSLDNMTYTLYDDGMNGDPQANDGRYGIHIWSFNEAPPPLGEYVFTVTDNDLHTATASDNLDLIIDYPRNVQPPNNTVVNSSTPVLSWDAVPGAGTYWLSVYDQNNNTIWSRDNITGTFVTYNDNGTGPELQEEINYHWQVNTGTDDASSWHDWSYFAWASDPDKPFIGTSGLWYRHYGDDEGNDQYYIELMARVNDPQGLDDIQSVTLTAPDSEEIVLSKNEGDPGAWNGQWSSNQPPALGDYLYTVTDLDGHTDSQANNLSQAQDFPRNVQPGNNEFVSTETPTFSWDPVEGINGYHVTVYDINNNQLWNQDIPVGSTSVVYNSDGLGQSLAEGSKYRWDISTWGDHVSTWHNPVSFTYSSSTDNPIFTYANVFSMYHGNNAGSEHPGVRLMADVNDPQGLSNIQSVIVTSPDFVTYTLYDDGQHGDDGAGDGRYGDYIWDPSQAIVPGNYTFDVTDLDEHSGSSSDMLDYILDYPRTLVPEQNGVMVPASPVFSWNPVDHAESYMIYVYAANGWDVVWHKNNITATSVEYNDDHTGIDLVEGTSYTWEIFANGYDGHSWHELSNFVYRTNTDRVIHVDIANNSGTEDGSEGHPFNTIQEGINASANGDTVLVNPGTYVENVSIIDKDILLTSLFVISDDENDINITIIDGNHTGTALLVQNSDINIHGLTVQNGQASAYGAGGVQIEGGNSVISHCVIKDNAGIGQDEWGAGGITFNNGNLQINNCVISGNSSPGGAAGIRAGGAHVDISNVLLADNFGNLAIHYNDVTGDITNSTIVNNSRAFGFNNSPINITNSIEWNNNGDYWGNIGIVSFSCTQVPYNGTGVIHSNPFFQNILESDFHLQMNSPCIDTGDPDMTDTDGSRVDMGYYGGSQGTSYTYLDGPPVMNFVNVNPAYVTSGQQLTITAGFSDAQTLVSLVTVDIENPDENVVISVDLFDDGNHSDGIASDGIFGNTVSENWLAGQQYLLDILASDDNSHTISANNIGTFTGIPAPEMVNLPFTSEAMAIDGSGIEAIWNGIAPVPVTRHLFGPIDNASDLSAAYKACWDLDNLYLLIDVTDDVLDNTHGTNAWENDKVTMYLDMDNSKGSSYDANDWNLTFVWQGGFYPNRSISGVNFAFHNNDQLDGYQLEISLPLKELGYPMADLLGFDLDVLDRDGENPETALLFWNSGINQNGSNPGLNGEATLLDYDENMPDQALKIVDLVDFPECGTTNALIKVSINNFGIVPVDQFDITYSINGTAINPAETVNMTINPGETVEYTFTTTADLSVTGRYSFNISTLLNGGDPHANFALITERTVFGSSDPYPNWTAYSTCNGLPDNGTRFVMEDSQGNIWVGTTHGGAARLDHQTGTWEIFNSDNSGLSNNNAITIFEDSYGIIWVGLDGEDGIVRSFDGTNWTSNNLGNVHVLTMFEDHAGNMWFGTWGSSGLRKWERATDTWITYNNQNSGLPSHDMWYGAIMEDEENNMWFGTISGGLVKFDGTNWTVFNTSNSGIPNDLVLGSLMDSNGDIWLAHGWSGQGVSRFNGSYFQVYNTGNSGLTSNQIANLFEDYNGNIWFGSWDNGVSKFNGNTWQSFNMDNSGLTSNSVNSITEDANGDIWFATSNGLCKYDAPDQAIKVVGVENFPTCGTSDASITVTLVNTGMLPIDQFEITYAINGISIDPAEAVSLTLTPGENVQYTFTTRANLSVTGNYTLYVSTLLNGGIPEYNESFETTRFIFGTDPYDDWISYNTCNGLPGDNVSNLIEDSQGNIWATISGTGVARLDRLTQTWTLFNSDNSGFTNNYAMAICEDHLGNIWVGLDGPAAVAMFDGTSWTSGNPDNIHVLAIMEDHAGNMWFGTWGYGVRKWDRTSDTWTTYTTANSGLPSNDMWFGAIMEDADNNMWFATLGGGLAKFDGTTWTVYNSGNSSIPNNTYWGSLLDSQGNIWLAHGWAMNDNNVDGVTRFDGTTFTSYNTGNSGIVSNKIFRVSEDSNGNLWFGSWGQGVSKFDGTTWENFDMNNSGLTGNSINAITEDADGNLWFAVNGICEYLIGTEPPEKHFVPVWTGNGQDHMNFYATAATIEGVPMQPGDEIGIFDGDACVGAGELTMVIDNVNYFEIRVSRDEPTTPEKDGYTAGNTASFRLWDDSEQREITDCNVIYTSGTNVFDIGATTWYEINGYLTVNQEISLTNGWNIFSLFVTPDDTSMMAILQPLISEGSLMKVQNEAGAAIEQMPGGAWLDNIHYWRKTEGYKIRVNTSTTLSVTGRPILQPVNINLLGGWNIMGYPSSSAQVAMTALDELITTGNLLKVQSETGAAIEPMPLNMGWIDNIHNLEPGEGYKIRVSVADALTITPSELTGGLKSASAELHPQYYRPNWTGNGYDHMNIYLTEMSQVSNLTPGDEIAVFDGNVCVGAAVIGNRSEKFVSVAVSADDPATAEIDGFVKGNAMSFRIWRPGDNKETQVNTVRFYAGYTDLFEPMGTTVAGVSIPANDMSELVTSFGDNYPNPFVLETTFSFALGETLPVNITLYNLLGEKVKILVSQTMEEGSYTTVWDATDQRGNRVTPGIYICKMIAGDYVAVKTVELTQ